MVAHRGMGASFALCAPMSNLRSFEPRGLANLKDCVSLSRAACAPLTAALATLIACSPTPAKRGNQSDSAKSTDDCWFSEGFAKQIMREDEFHSLLGVADFEVRDCRSESLPSLLRDSPWFVPAKRSSMRVWSSIDSHVTYACFDFVDAEFDTAGYSLARLQEFVETHGEADTGRGTRDDYAPPAKWPLRPDSANKDFARRPAWWDHLPGQAALIHCAQFPRHFKECGVARARGVMTVEQGDRFCVHTWSYQHFYPGGGCGG